MKNVSTQEKKQYVRPQLLKHGAVETLTQSKVGGPSQGMTN